MNKISSTASLKGDAERQEAASSWLHCWPHVRTQRGLLTIAMCLLLVCAAFMGVFGYGFGLGRLADRCSRLPSTPPTRPQIQQLFNCSVPDVLLLLCDDVILVWLAGKRSLCEAWHTCTQRRSAAYSR